MLAISTSLLQHRYCVGDNTTATVYSVPSFSKFLLTGSVTDTSLRQKIVEINSGQQMACIESAGFAGSFVILPSGYSVQCFSDVTDFCTEQDRVVPFNPLCFTQALLLSANFVVTNTLLSVFGP